MILWTVASQAPLSVGFPRQENWSGFPFASPGNLPHPGMEPALPVSLASQADSLPAEPLVSTHPLLIEEVGEIQTGEV